MDRGNRLHGPNRSEACLSSGSGCGSSCRRRNPSDARFEMAGRARQGERHKISSTIRSQHKPMHATLGGPLRAAPHAPHEPGVDARLKFGRSVCLGSGVAVPNPENAQAAVTATGGARVRTDHPARPLHIPSLRSRQQLLFWLGGPCGSKPATRKMQGSVSRSASTLHPAPHWKTCARRPSSTSKP
jgi:hypothetical protein